MSGFRALMTVGVTVLALTSAAKADPTREGVVACIPIKTVAQLQAINNNATSLAAAYCLMNDIDLGSIPNWTPIGSAAPYFHGRFYGNGHVVRNLKITTSLPGNYGLFSVVAGGSIRDLGVINADIKVTGAGSDAGALLGVVAGLTSPVVLVNVHSTGRVRCIALNCSAGGLLGLGSMNITVSDAWSSADVTAGLVGGGLAAGFASGPSSYERIYATGNVTGTATSTEIGGLLGQLSGASNISSVVRAFATGRVTGSTNTQTGGLIGTLGVGGYLLAAYATGPVSGGGSATVGGLVGLADTGTIEQSFSVGPVTGGATHGGLVGAVMNTPTVSSSYWDKTTSGLTTSAAGSRRTTTQLRNALPVGFAGNWGISKALSYPFLSDPDNFTSTLATLVSSNVVFAFLPIQQSDVSQYLGHPAHTDEASLAAVYTMIARAVGVSDNVATLKNVKIDKYFWRDTTQTTTFRGPVTAHATLGAMKTLAANAHLDATNVAGQMNAHRLVILRGTYKKGAVTATHYMLGTMYTKKGAGVRTIVANDPWTGTQVEISPISRKVVTPGFPLPTFKVNGYQPVMTLH
jgi:hypothetical protein